MSGTMRAYQLVRAGVAEVVDLPIPEPGPGQVRLKMAGAGLCHSDLLVMQADPSFFPIPSILGHETTGWVDKLGSGVQRIEPGAAYGIYFPWGCGQCAPCARGAENVCDKAPAIPGFGCGVDGGMAEYVIVDDPRHLIPLGTLDPVAAAPLMCAGITTYHAVLQASPLLGPGSSAVIIGVGGLGHIAIQILRTLTLARIIAVDRQPEKLAHALALGADEAVAAGEGAAAAIRELTGGLGAALVLDLVGNDSTLAFAQSVLAQGGQLQIVGVGGGTLPLRFHEMPRDATVAVPYAGTCGDLRAVIGLAQQGHVHAEIVEVGFDELAQTYARMGAGTLQGRAVLVPGR
jgi:propanol-preferring alcohol dehydrogenase